MKLADLRITEQEQQITEMAELFAAIGHYKVMLSEGRLDEAGAWDRIKGMVGKGAAGVKTANDAINRLGTLAQNTGPVQNFDSKVDGLLKKIGAANPKVAELATKYGEWAKKNPIKQGLIMGMLTAVASLVAGPAGGAAAGAVLRAGNELLKGEKASTAVGKGLKGAAVGAAAGAAASILTGPIADTLSSMRIEQLPMPKMPEMITNTITIDGNSRVVMLLKSDKDMLTSIHEKIQAIRQGADPNNDWTAFSKIKELMDQYRQQLFYLRSPEYAKKILDTMGDYEAAKDAIKSNDTALSLINGVAKTINAAAQGAGTAANTDPSPRGSKPAVKTAAQPAATTPDKRADLKARQQAWQAQQRRMGKLK